MVHLDLFSGIGGFAYAIDRVWENVEHIFCDNDPFCRQVIRKHWPESEIYHDIKDITNAPSGGSQEKLSAIKARGRRPNLGADIVTGGFPCQPFSAAGVRRGTGDERYLWPAMFEVICLAKPTWVIAENVSGLLTWEEGVVFNQVCSDLEGAGYEVQPFIIPAVAVNAPHRRDRIWFVAHRPGDRRPGQRPGSPDEEGYAPGSGKTRKLAGRPEGSDSHAEDAQRQRSRGRHEDSRQVLARQVPEDQDARPSWETDWFEVATELCSVDDGLPVRLDGFELSKPAHRKEQIKAYGNAIVPEVAEEIMRGIAKVWR